MTSSLRAAGPSGLALVALMTFVMPPPAVAADTLLAAQACPAFQSIAKQTNPGGIRLTAGQSYPIVAQNKQPPTWLQVEIEGASPKQRWVAISCALGDTTPVPSHGGTSTAGAASHLLALSWEPTFCQGMPGKAECAAETSQSSESKQLSLHGLWPEPKGKYYCIADAAQKAKLAKLDSKGDWDQLPDPGLSAATRARLAAVMPGTQSMLERHEWIKHGTCFGGSPDAYFNRAADLLEQVNASAVGQLVSTNVGKPVKSAQILAAFDQAFGDGSSAAVAVSCKTVGGKGELSEIDVYMSGDVAGSAPLSKLLHVAPPHTNCSQGLIIQPPR